MGAGGRGMGGDDDGCARSDWSGVTKLPQEALLWRDVSDLSAIDLSAIDLSARLGGSNDLSVWERELGDAGRAMPRRVDQISRYEGRKERTRRSGR